jgi:hypothetical protein
MREAAGDTRRVPHLVHDVNFCQHADCSNTVRVNFSSKLKSVRVCEIRVGWSYGLVT